MQQRPTKNVCFNQAMIYLGVGIKRVRVAVDHYGGSRELKAPKHHHLVLVPHRHMASPGRWDLPLCRHLLPDQSVPPERVLGCATIQRKDGANPLITTSPFLGGIFSKYIGNH